MIGIAVGQSTKTNALSVYNPITNQYYEPDMYKFDPSTSPAPSPSHISTMMGNYTLTSTATAKKNTPETYPPGMPLKIPSNKDDDNNYTTSVVSSIPIRDLLGITVPCQYLLQIHDGSTFTKILTKMNAITNFPINKTRVAPNPSLPVVESLPAWLQHCFKVTYNHAEEFHNLFIMIYCDGVASSSYRHQRSSKAE